MCAKTREKKRRTDGSYFLSLISFRKNRFSDWIGGGHRGLSEEEEEEELADLRY
jgi:hypothetical protein